MLFLSKLKEMVAKSTDLNATLDYFFDMMDANEIFNMPGHREVQSIESNPQLITVVNAIEAETLNQLHKKIKINMVLFNEIPEHHFYHGICIATPQLSMPITVIYFSDIGTGIFAVIEMEKNNIFRFALVKAFNMKNKVMTC